MKKAFLIFAVSIGVLWGQNLKLTIRFFDSVDKNPYLIDTSYYIVDQTSFHNNREYLKDKIDSFTDFKEVDSLQSKEHWFYEINAFDDYYTYISGGLIYDQIVDYLIRRKLLSLGKD